MNYQKHVPLLAVVVVLALTIYNVHLTNTIRQTVAGLQAGGPLAAGPGAAGEPGAAPVTAADLVKQPPPGPDGAPNPDQAIIEERAQARDAQAVCLSNLQQIGLGLMMYCQDYDETMVSARRWPSKLDPYLRNTALFACPTAPPQAREYSYGYNARLSGIRLATVASPSETVALFESDLGRRDVAGGAEAVATSPMRHNNGNNWTFTDGHCKWSEQLMRFGP